ncbi:MAG: LysE family transporter [Bacteroidia bacterium]|jgi:threonine/homoserine/homoserine lactone efflux protein|nr:LysE family transporter [Bacteroidia bacterium]MBP7244872.1 LysE family transporter [Bacteroidia bacterium]
MGIDVFISFLFATVISFVGSLQPGLVNMGVLYAGYHHSRNAAIKMALGGILPEIIYSAIALFLYKKAAEFSFIKETLNILFIPLLLMAGIYLLKKKPSKEEIKNQNGHDFTNGFMIGMVNPLLIPFWLIWIQQVVQRGYLELSNFYTQAAFVLGTAVGALVLLLVVAFNTVRYKTQLEKIIKGRLNFLLGLICIILACVELFRLLMG